LSSDASAYGARIEFESPILPKTGGLRLSESVEQSLLARQDYFEL